MNAQNYTPEQTLQIVEGYKAGQSVEDLAALLGKSVRSVVAKLSREGVYQKKVFITSGRMTKEDLVNALEVSMEMAPGSLISLTKADKASLEALARHMGLKA
jgi:hypothetical protein